MKRKNSVYVERSEIPQSRKSVIELVLMKLEAECIRATTLGGIEKSAATASSLVVIAI